MKFPRLADQVLFLFYISRMKTEDFIIKGMKAKEESSLSLLVNYYGRALMAIATGIVDGRSEIAEEVVQKSYLKIWNNIDLYDPTKSTLYTWMARITRNTALDERKLKSFSAFQKTKPIDSTVPYYTHTNQSDSIDVKNLLKGIDEKYAFVLSKIYIEGHTHMSVAEEFSIPLGTVKTRLQKGVELLRNNLKAEEKLFISLVLILLFILIML